MAAHSEARPRLVVVKDYDRGERVASVALLSNEVDLATDADLTLPPQETGLTFPILLQPGLVGPVWEAQLGPRLGQVPLDALEGHDSDMRGFPLRGAEDARWAFKEKELGELRGLTTQCMRTLLDQDGGGMPRHVDSELISDLLDRRDESLYRLLGADGHSRFEPLPASVARQIVRQVKDPAQEMVLQMMLLQSLGSDVPDPPPAEVRWTPERRVSAEDFLAATVAESARLHVHAVCIATTERVWRDIPIAADTAYGRVQLIPELL
jgi:hypothetical protein